MSADLNIHQSFDSMAPPLDDEDKVVWSFDELQPYKDSKQDWIIDDLLPRGVVVTFFGEDGIGKTQLTTQLALAIGSKAKSVISHELKCNFNRSLIVATEDGKENFSKALFTQARAMGLTEGVGLDFMEAGEFDELNIFVARLKKQLHKQKYDIIIVDALSDVFTIMEDGGEVNSNRDARAIIKVFQNIVKETDSKTTVILIHHVPKTKVEAKKKEKKLFLEKNDGQGASAITQKPRHVLGLSFDPSTENDAGHINYLHVVKSNVGGKRYKKHAIKLQFDATTLQHEYVDLIDIRLFENPDGMSSPEEHKASASVKNHMSSMNRYDHAANIALVFSQMDKLRRKDLIPRMKDVYKVGNSAIERDGGILHQALESGALEKIGEFYYRPAPPGFKQQNMEFNDEEPPF